MVFISRAKELHAPILFADQLYEVTEQIHRDTCQQFTVRSRMDGETFTLELDLQGDYQRLNLLTVLATLDVLNGAGGAADFPRRRPSRTGPGGPFDRLARPMADSRPPAADGLRHRPQRGGLARNVGPDRPPALSKPVHGTGLRGRQGDRSGLADDAPRGPLSFPPRPRSNAPCRLKR